MVQIQLESVRQRSFFLVTEAAFYPDIIIPQFCGVWSVLCNFGFQRLMRWDSEILAMAEIRPKFTSMSPKMHQNFIFNFSTFSHDSDVFQHDSANSATFQTQIQPQIQPTFSAHLFQIHRFSPPSRFLVWIIARFDLGRVRDSFDSDSSDISSATDGACKLELGMEGLWQVFRSTRPPRFSSR